MIRERTRKTLAGYGLSTAEVEGFMNAPLNGAPEEAPAGPAGRP